MGEIISTGQLNGTVSQQIRSTGAGKEIRTLYHYTNEKGMNGIVESKQLNPSFRANNPKDARYGDGQYLSDIRPDTQTPTRLAKNLLMFLININTHITLKLM